MKTKMAAAALALVLAATAAAQAQSSDYPSRAITIVVPYPAGGGNDVIARLVASKLAERLKRPVIVENRAGAAGSIGTMHVAQAAPDGYTLLSASQSHGLAQEVFKDAKFDANRDFAAIIKVGESTSLLLANPDRPYKTLQQLIDYAKANPGKVKLATAGPASPADFVVRLLKTKGIDIVPVPYAGSTPALTDTVGGHVDVIVDPMSSSIEFAKSGKLNLLAVTTAKRLSSLPEVPAMSEVGVDIDVIGWFGYFAPTGTPAAILTRLNKEIGEILQEPAVLARLEQLAVTPPIGGKSEELAAFVRSELIKWAALMKNVGLEKQ